MKKKLFSMFVSSLVFTVCFFWLSHGPHLEGLNQYTALSFASGLLCGIGWGMFLSAWVASELKKNA